MRVHVPMRRSRAWIVPWRQCDDEVPRLYHGLFIFGMFVGVGVGITTLMHGGPFEFVTGVALYGVYRIAMQDGKDIWK